MDKATIKFMPVIYKDEHLHQASQGIGATECRVFGNTEQQLFENIKEKSGLCHQRPSSSMKQRQRGITSGLQTAGRHQYLSASTTWDSGTCASPSPTRRHSNDGSERTTNKEEDYEYDMRRDLGHHPGHHQT